LRTADADFALLVGLQFGAAGRIDALALGVRDQQAGGPWPAHGRIDRRGRNHRAGLGQSVALGDETVEAVAAGLFDVSTQWRRPRVDRPQRTEVVFLDQRML